MPRTANVLGCPVVTFRGWLAGRSEPDYSTRCAVERQMREDHDPLTDRRPTLQVRPGSARLRSRIVIRRPHGMPLWQIASAPGSVIAIALWLFARSVLRRAKRQRAPAGTTVRGVWRAVRAVGVMLPLHTISRPALITWHEGRLAANLHRLWNSIGRRVLP